MAETNATAKKAERITHRNVFAALSALQGELKPVEKTGHVKFNTQKGVVDFKYAPLGDIMEMLYPLLAKHGLSVRHELGDNTIECVLTHETAEYKEMKRETHYNIAAADFEQAGEQKKDRDLFALIPTNEIRSGKISLKSSGADMKDTGAAITYARRYTIGLVLGIASEEDKDAELLEQSKQNAVNFAFGKAKEKLEQVSGEELAKQVEYLRKELELAEAVEAGKGKKAPSLGLKAAQYKELIELGTSRMGAEEAQ